MVGFFRKVLSQHSGIDVGGPTCSKRDNEFDRAVGIVLRDYRPCQQNRKNDCSQTQKCAHKSSPLKSIVQTSYNVALLSLFYVPPADLKLGARSLAAAKAPLASTEVSATVVRSPVTPLPLPAANSTAAICTSFGTSAIVRKSYSPKVR